MFDYGGIGEAFMIKFGLLGCGRIAKRHADLLGGNLVSGATLTAVCDPVRERADAVASKFGVPADYEIGDFLTRKDIDAVAVLTPSGIRRGKANGIAAKIVGSDIAHSVQ